MVDWLNLGMAVLGAIAGTIVTLVAWHRRDKQEAVAEAEARSELKAKVKELETRCEKLEAESKKHFASDDKLIQTLNNMKIELLREIHSIGQRLARMEGSEDAPVPPRRRSGGG